MNFKFHKTHITMLSHLIYVSKRAAICTEAEIEKILASCLKNNKSADVTGVLLYSKTHFLQYLEGEYNEISTLYDKIKLDQRHQSAMMISSAPISSRSFPSWQMGAKKFDSDQIEFQTDLNGEEKKVFDSILSGQEQNNEVSISLIKKFFK